MTDTVDPATRSAIMRAVRSTNTGPELAVRKLAHSLGLRFRLHRRDLPGTPDLAFPGCRKVVFVHGCFWHRHGADGKGECARGRSTPATRTDFWEAKFARNVARDRRDRRRLRAAGWGVMVVWECQTRRLDPARRGFDPAARDRLAGRLRRFLG